MKDNKKIRLFNESSTTLVYIASDEFAKELMGEKRYHGELLYIHVGRDKGSVDVYLENDVNKRVHINMNIHEYILQCAENIR